eukprot:GHVO01070229.1.p1 GENE.GHVO01070229.1~~GHVO01070229.1.p1  ORF type:complete len:329 (-),score=76.36 GHVO01070229.1:16-897(-)
MRVLHDADTVQAKPARPDQRTPIMLGNGPAVSAAKKRPKSAYDIAHMLPTPTPESSGPPTLFPPVQKVNVAYENILNDNKIKQIVKEHLAEASREDKVRRDVENRRNIERLQRLHNEVIAEEEARVAQQAEKTPPQVNVREKPKPPPPKQPSTQMIPPPPGHGHPSPSTGQSPIMQDPNVALYDTDMPGLPYKGPAGVVISDGHLPGHRMHRKKRRLPTPLSINSVHEAPIHQFTVIDAADMHMSSMAPLDSVDRMQEAYENREKVLKKMEEDVKKKKRLRNGTKPSTQQTKV